MYRIFLDPADVLRVVCGQNHGQPLSLWEVGVASQSPSQSDTSVQACVQSGDVLLGKYRVERVLGQGGMGIVVAARHIELGELFAIKLLLPSTLVHAEVVERFVREARATARLKSDHVARVHDVGRLETGAPYMVMEHLDGNDLKAIVRKQGALPITDVVTYVLQACDAIAEAHALGLVHRDLKPANLFLIRRSNGSESVKVLDFGISKQTGTEEVELTATGAILGSPMYMSPEQIAKSKSVDARTDIWAMGVVLYELLTGHGPFRAKTVLELAAQVLQEEPASPRTIRPEISEALESIVIRCLQKKAAQRFQSINELVIALRAAPLETSQKNVHGTEGLVRPPGPSFSELLPLVPHAVAPVVVPSSTVPSTTMFAAMPERTIAMQPSITVKLPGESSGAAVSSVPVSSTLPSPVLAPVPAVQESTGQTWGGTHNGGAPRRQTKGIAIAVAVTGFVMLAGGGLWFALGSQNTEPPISNASAALPAEIRSIDISSPSATPSASASATLQALAPAQRPSSTPVLKPKVPVPSKPISNKPPGVE